MNQKEWMTVPVLFAASLDETLDFWEALGYEWDPTIDVPNEPVHGLKENLGRIADFIYGSPSQSLWTIGVTALRVARTV